MTDNQKQLGTTLWKIADDLRGAMNADDFRDYMLSFLFLRYLSDNYEIAAKKELGKDYPKVNGDDRSVPLALWYADNPKDVPEFEKQMRRKVHYVIQPQHLWNSIANMARTQSGELLHTLQAGFKYIETESFESTFQGLFSEINLGSDKLGKKYEDRNAKLCTIIQKIAEGLNDFSTDIDALGDAYEYLIGQFAAGSGKKAGEFYTPQQISDILSAIVTLDSQEPKTGPKQRLDRVLDFACGSGSLLLNVRNRIKKAGGTIGKIFGQESNITTYNLARMNMLLHGVKDSEFEIFHGDTLLNEWDMICSVCPHIAAATWLGRFFAKSVAPEALRFCQSFGHCVTPALWIINVKPFRRFVSAWIFGKTYSAPSSASAKSFKSSVSIAGNKGRIRTARFAWCSVLLEATIEILFASQAICSHFRPWASLGILKAPSLARTKSDRQVALGAFSSTFEKTSIGI